MHLLKGYTLSHQKLYNPDYLKQAAASQKKAFKKLAEHLKTMKSGEVDRLFSGLHDDFFEEINCLDCGNCCRSLGPRITGTDIDQLAKGLGIKSSLFIERYLVIDEDNDYVFKSMPCPFLQSDNYCSVYENRPKACRDYPHTNQAKIQTILSVCQKNTVTCPVVYLIFNQLIKNSLK